MKFAYLVLLTGLLLEILGTIISVKGFMALVGFNLIIFGIVICLDIAKIVTASMLFNYWKEFTLTMRSYAIFVIMVTMIITSAGSGAFLFSEFQKAFIGSTESSTKITILEEQLNKLEDRKTQIDAQISNLPENTKVSQRIRLINAFKQEQEQIQGEISKINQILPDLKISQVSVEAKTGPIIFISKSFGVPVEKVIKYVVGMIVTIFDPLAVFLVLSANYILSIFRKDKKQTNEITSTDEVLVQPNTVSQIPNNESALPSASNEPSIAPSSRWPDSIEDAPKIEQTILPIPDEIPQMVIAPPVKQFKQPEIIGKESLISRISPTPITAAVETITKEKLTRPSLADVKADDSVIFTDETSHSAKSIYGP